ncbi:hypothetical protein Q8A67_005364 [Cirrhinus molitorella]|uniref:Fibrinogen C-terminal domain-containing protein n=1 Tax=Cirrhinus molitorella TaxID=172907 RepID=A0AA88TVQ9_9TELE|nr:hypothetical protein Q8A67_005364 [Cirrhinus molitorella]
MVDKMVAYFGPEETGKITVDILRKMKQNHLANYLENKLKEGSNAENGKADLHDYREISLRLKNKLKWEYNRILVGNSQMGHREYLNDIYTDLYAVENETGGIVSEHEVIQRRMDGSVNFYQPWNQYKRGFGNVEGEHWLGLENMYQMTRNRKYMLRVDMEDFEGRKSSAL